MPQKCATCKQDIINKDDGIVVERLNIHKKCFGCGYCEAPLKLGYCALEHSLASKYGAWWFCQQHSKLPPPEKRAKLEQRVQAIQQGKEGINVNADAAQQKKNADAAAAAAAAAAAEAAKKAAQNGAASQNKSASNPAASKYGGGNMFGDAKPQGKCKLCGKDITGNEASQEVERVLMHSACFKCAFCDTSLLPGSCAIDHSLTHRFGPRWFCGQHSLLSPGEKTAQLEKKGLTKVK